MASLVLLLSELLKHQDPDLLISLPAAGAVGGATAASASKRDADMIRRAAAARCSGGYGTNCNAELFADDFQKVSVEMVWP